MFWGPLRHPGRPPERLIGNVGASSAYFFILILLLLLARKRVTRVFAACSFLLLLLLFAPNSMPTNFGDRFYLQLTLSHLRHLPHRRRLRKGLPYGRDRRRHLLPRRLSEYSTGRDHLFPDSSARSCRSRDASRSVRAGPHAHHRGNWGPPLLLQLGHLRFSGPGHQPAQPSDAHGVRTPSAFTPT